MQRKYQYMNDTNIFLDLEWKMIYVGSAESEEFDQVLDTIYVGPIPEGRHMFVFQVKYHELNSLSYSINDYVQNTQ